MKILRLLSLLPFLYAFSAAPAMAEPKPWRYGWWPWHYNSLDFSKRYLQEGKIPNHAGWGDDDFSPGDWTESRQGGKDDVIQGFYNAGIITGRSTDDDCPFIDTGKGIPVLEVGPAFMRLSDKDKRRVVMYIDETWGATARHGILYINHKKWGKPIGIYTKAGLQIQ
jgi:hypothetical protein